MEGNMRAGSSYVATAVALGIITLTGCAAESAEDQDVPGRGEDWGDENKYPEIGGAFASLEVLDGTCAFANGVVTVTAQTDPGASQTIIIGKRAVDSAILVNGNVCNTATMPITAATSSTMKRLVVTGTADIEILILDFLGGLLAPGVASATAGGIAIDLLGGTDEVRIRGTAAADTFYLGSDGIAVNADNYKDLTLSNVEAVNIALAGGNDTLTATNAALIKGVTGNFGLPLRLFGGAGNDTIVGGGVIDNIYGGPGNDTLSGGAGADNLYGEDGADTMQQGDAPDGNDALDCGEESPTDTSIDIVSYDKRTAVVTATVGANGVVTGGDTDTINANCEGITGGTQDDVLTGDTGANVLSGGPGNDELVGLDGADTLNGNDGNDTFDEGATPNGGDIFNGGAGTDVVDYSARTASLTVTMDGSSANDGEDGEEDNVKADVENLLGGTVDDTITGNTLANTLTGGAGNDVLSGLAGNDVFDEGTAANGGDQFIGGLGIDKVDYSGRSAILTVTMDGVDADDGDGTANENDDVEADVEDLIAGSGDDNITGNAGDNRLEGGTGDDTLSGGAGDDFLDGTDTGVGVDNQLVCGLGDDIAINLGDDGAAASDCEL
jgi:Ca2+-binding RTX toxin-like protein